MTLQRRRVLFIVPSLAAGGAERAMVSLLRHLDRSRFEPHLALLEKAGPYLADLPPDVPVHDLQTSRVRYALPGIIRLAWKLRPQAVLSTLGELNLAMAFAKPWLPPRVRVLLREVTSVSADLAQSTRHPRVWQWLYRHLYVRADKIICVADSILNDLAEYFGVPREKMVRIYNPVDFERIKTLAEAGENPYSGPGPHLVAVGRLSKVKGFDILLDALAWVRRAIPHITLTIVGGGPLEHDLKAQRERLNLTAAVHLAGFQPNPYPYLKHADLLVLSSRYEGLPNVILEALALRTPVVATDCPGGAREILAGCAMGWLVPNSDPQRLAEAIIAALNSGRKGFPSAEGLPDFLARFRVEWIVREYEDLLSL